MHPFPSASRTVRLVRHAWLVALLLALGASDVHCEPHSRNIRVVDAFMNDLLGHGMRASPSFRALVRRLTGADVVVYVRREWDIPLRHSGRLRLLSATGGYRYLVVSVQPDMSQLQQVAALGHELQHAVEIAETPAIVDRASLRAAYRRSGFLTGRQTSRETCETLAAIEQGRRVLQELVRFARAGGPRVARGAGWPSCTSSVRGRCATRSPRRWRY